MSAKRIFGFVVGAVVAVAVGLAVLNRAKKYFPALSTAIGQ